MADKGKEEQSPLATLIAKTEDTNYLLKEMLTRMSKQDEKEEEDGKDKGGDKDSAPEAEVEKAMEQTSQGKAKEVDQEEKPWDYDKDGQAGQSAQPTDYTQKGVKTDEGFPYSYTKSSDGPGHPYPYPYPEITSKREEVLAKALETANSRILDLQSQMSKMVPVEKVESVVNERFQTMMKSEGFVAAGGLVNHAPGETAVSEAPQNLEKSDDGVASDLDSAAKEAQEFAQKDWGKILEARQKMDPYYMKGILGNRAPLGLTMKGGTR